MIRKQKYVCYCCVPDCYNSTKQCFSFHRFPSNPKQKKIWETVLGLDRPVFSSSRVCSEHFKESDFFNIYKGVIKKPRLKLTAIPSQKLPERQNDNEESIEVKIEVPSPNDYSEYNQDDSSDFADVLSKIKQEKIEHEVEIEQDPSLTPSGHAQLKDLTKVAKKLPLGIGFLSNFKWLNEPREWSFKNNVLTLKTEDKTDFWQGTWYNSYVNTGHVYGVELKDDFTVEVCVEGGFESPNDQAGLMIYVDEKHWLKAGIEYNKDQPMIGSILTNEVSDWATGVFQGDPSKFWLRLTKMGNVVCVKYSPDNSCWHSLRLSTFPVFEKYFVGPMCCTPERGGLIVRFSHLMCSRVPSSRQVSK